MYVVPLAGDRITNKNGLPFKVVSFTNYKKEGPAVIAEPLGGGESETVLFTEIDELNGQKPRFIKDDKAFKVFEIDGVLDREWDLPQPGDKFSSGDRSYKLVRLKLHVKDELSRGLILVSTSDEADGTVDLVLGNIDAIDGARFAKAKFLAYYSDYREKGTA
jgi:hypothetical protein